MNTLKKMLADRRERLESLGFHWQTVPSHVKSETRWNKQLEKLKLYKSIHGDCAVPIHYGKDFFLAHNSR